jgi:hypothetical protein
MIVLLLAFILYMFPFLYNRYKITDVEPLGYLFYSLE